ncbi:MAG: tetratricopeptide repeat protein [Woeseiaceae bacterium]
MPIAISAIIQVALIIHVIKTDRPYYWIFIIMMPGIGALAYIIVELMPEFLGSWQGRRAVRGVRKTLNPMGDLRQREREHQMSGSVDAARHLAGELIENGQYEEAIVKLQEVLTGLYENDPDLLLSLATAQFGNDQFADAMGTLDRLIEHNPDYRSAEGHLIYAQSVERCGDTDKALEEYEAVAAYYAGAEAKLRYGRLLEQTGDPEKALQQYSDIINAAEMAPRHYQKAQREWISEAREGFRRLAS